MRAELSTEPAMPPRARRCGQSRFTRQPSIETKDGHAWWSGVVRCRSRVCPVCWVSRRAQLAQEITWVAEQWCDAHPGVPPQLATLTVRHTAQDSAELCKQVRGCWRAMLQGAGWKHYKKERGVELLAAEEVTHGEHGWHPHIHVLLLPARAQETDLYVADAAWWSDRWRRIVARKLGERYIPSETHGTDLRPCKVGDYLSKLGIELSDSAAVKGRAPLELLRQGERALYLELQRTRHRARDVTWSRGLRGLRDSLPTPEAGTVLLQPAAYEWERAREHGQLLHALEAAETGGAPAARAALWSSPQEVEHGEQREDPHSDAGSSHPSNRAISL